MKVVKEDAGAIKEGLVSIQKERYIEDRTYQDQLEEYEREVDKENQLTDIMRLKLKNKEDRSKELDQYDSQFAI